MGEANRRQGSVTQPVAPTTIYSNYDPSPSSLSYSTTPAVSAGGMSNVSPQTMSTHSSTASTVMSRLSKASATTPTSPQSTWTQRHPSQPAENYGPPNVYNQLSPARSPSGPTYTQLGSATTSRGQLFFHLSQSSRLFIRTDAGLLAFFQVCGDIRGRVVLRQVRKLPPWRRLIPRAIRPASNRVSSRS